MAGQPGCRGSARVGPRCHLGSPGSELGTVRELHLLCFGRPYSSPVRWVTSLSPFYRGEAEALGPRVTPSCLTTEPSPVPVLTCSGRLCTVRPAEKPPFYLAVLESGS